MLQYSIQWLDMEIVLLTMLGSTIKHSHQLKDKATRDDKWNAGEAWHGASNHGSRWAGEDWSQRQEASKQHGDHDGWKSSDSAHGLEVDPAHRDTPPS